VLRGIAALCIVFWRWQHFFFAGAEPTSTFAGSKQPLVGIFSVFYNNGWLAVDLFFPVGIYFLLALFEPSLEPRYVGLGFPCSAFLSALRPLAADSPLGHDLAVSVQPDNRLLFRLSAQRPLSFSAQFAVRLQLGGLKGYSFNGPMWSVSVVRSDQAAADECEKWLTQSSVSAKLKNECGNHSASQLFQDLPLATYRGGIGCDNLEAVTFANERLDLYVM
jgi:hypothetical protein